MNNKFDINYNNEWESLSKNNLNDDLQNMHSNLQQTYMSLKNQIIMNENVSEKINTIVKDFNNFCIALSNNPIDYAQRYMYENYFDWLPREYSSLPVSHASEYKKYVVDTQDNSCESLIGILSEVIDLLKKPVIIGEPTPEKKQYMDEFKSIFDKWYEDPEFKGKKNYMFDGLWSYREKLLKKLPENQKIFGKIVRSTYFNKDRMLAHIKKQKSWLEEQKAIFHNQWVVYKEISNKLISYWKDLKKYHDMSLWTISIKLHEEWPNYITIQDIVINWQFVELSFKNDTQKIDIPNKIVSLREAMKYEIHIQPL